MERCRRLDLVPGLLVGAIFVIGITACDPPKHGSAASPAAATSKKADEETSPRGDAEAESKSADEVTRPRGEAPDPAPLEEAVEAEHQRAHTALFDSEECESESLERCRTFEDESRWEEAGRCYRRTFDGELLGDCRMMQQIESAISYRKAGDEQKAMERWGELEKRAFSLVGVVLHADYALEKGRLDAASLRYELYLSEEDHTSLNEYVRAQCARIGGCSQD